MEEWRTVVIDGEVWDNYEVSNLGRVRSLNWRNSGKVKVLKQHDNGKGYLQVALSGGGTTKYYLIHRLVVNAFIPNPNNYVEVNHIDENKSNNHVDNLEWITHKENMNHGTRTERSTKIRSKKIRCIETNEIYNSMAEVERKLGLNQGSISRVCNGKRKTCGGYHWEYVD